jgi:hypothetical protein
MSTAGLRPAPRAECDRRARVTNPAVASFIPVPGPVHAPATARHETTGHRR